MYSFQLGMNQRIIQLPRNLETLFKMVGLPFFQFKGAASDNKSAPSFSFSSFSSKNSKLDIQPLFFCCTALFVFASFVHLFAIPFIPFRKRIEL